MNHSATTKTPDTGYFLDDLDDGGFNAPASPTSTDDIKKNAHIANGGEEQFKCPSCKGTGAFYGYSGRHVGDCFKCKGKGRISKGQNAAAKGKITKEANKAKWLEDHAAECAYINERADRWEFMRSMQDSVREYGKLTDNQLAAVHRAMAKDAERKEAKKAERIAAAPVVEISAIEKLFATAVENDVKRPIFRADGLEISKAPANGRNAGALYVKAAGEYAGKIVDGKFHKVYAAPADTVDRLMAVAADPLKEAMAYGRKFGNCALCGRDLVDPVSIRAKVGPICGPRWGLDHLRMEAAAMLAAEKAEENS